MAHDQRDPGDGEIQVSREGRITRLTFVSPGKKNALNQAMCRALRDALNAAASAPDVSVVLLQGADGTFSNGNDASDTSAPPPGEKAGTLQFIETIAAFPKPIVAQVEGVASGLGCTMLLHCDLVYAAEDARFRLPFINLGLIPEAASTYLLPRLMGAARAAELALLGEVFSAAHALEVGLVSAVLPPQDLAGHVQSRAEALAAKPPAAVARTKALLRRVPQAPVMTRIGEESEAIAASLAGPEFAEVLLAFREKRAPDFSRI